MVPNAEKLVEVFINGLPRSIEGNVTASKPQTLEEAINIAHRLMDQIIKRDSVLETNDRKRKLEDERNIINNNNNNRNNDYHRQQNRRQETFRTYTATNGYAVESVSKQGRKFAKGEPSVHKDPLFDEIMETEDAQDVGRTRDVVDEEKENDEDQSKGTDDHTEEGSATQTTQPPTSTIFGDDETIAKVLLNMSQAKAVSREKEKGVEFKDIKETVQDLGLLQQDHF
ncbi:hypothetical protein Tco_1547725 [Tanacetum coccineum]